MHHLARCFVQQSRHFIQDGGIVADDAKIFRNFASEMGSKVLIISNTNELVRVKPERVVYVESDGNYSTMVLHDKTEHVFTMNLAHCQELIEQQLGKETSNLDIE